MLIGCSRDSGILPKTTQNTDLEQIGYGGEQQRIGNDTFEQYVEILENVYDNYSILNETIEIEDGGKEYLVTEVHVDENLKGYFVEFPLTGQSVYLDRNDDFITLYDNYNEENPVQEYNLNFDQDYEEIGFSPYEPTENSEQGRKFFGNEETTTVKFMGFGMCATTVTNSFYVFWIKVSSTSTTNIGPCD